VIRDPATGAIAMDGEVVAERLAMHLVAASAFTSGSSSASRCRPPSRTGDATPYRPGLRTAALAISGLRAKVALQRTGRARLSALVEASLPTAEQRRVVRRAHGVRSCRR